MYKHLFFLDEIGDVVTIQWCKLVLSSTARHIFWLDMLQPTKCSHNKIRYKLMHAPNGSNGRLLLATGVLGRRTVGTLTQHNNYCCVRFALGVTFVITVFIYACLSCLICAS